MAGIISDDLFQLIRTLTKAEKRYFKLYAGSAGSKGFLYIKLFDLVERQKKYDEGKILRKIKSLKKGNISGVKNYLYQLILDALRSLHYHSNTDAEIRSMISDINILLTKKLYTRCGSLIKKAKKMAYAYEKQRLLTEILSMEETYLIENASGANREKNIAEVFKEDIVNTNKIENTIRYRELNNPVTDIYIKEGGLLHKDSILKLEKIIKHPLLKEKKKLLSYHDHYFFYNIYFIYYLAKADWNNAYRNRKAMLGLMESKPEQMEDNPSISLVVLSGFLSCCQYTSRYDEMLVTFEKIKNIFSLSDKRNEYILDKILACHINVLGYYIRTGNFKEGVKLAKEIEPRLSALKYEVVNQIQTSLFYSLAYVHFGEGTYKEALFWLNRTLNEGSRILREDIQAMARIFKFVIHFELGHMELMDSLVRSTYRFLSKTKKLYRSEERIINFIRLSLPKIITKSDQLKAFSDLRNDLVKIYENPEEGKLLSYFDLISWLESKMENRSFGNIVREKLKGKR